MRCDGNIERRNIERRNIEQGNFNQSELQCAEREVFVSGGGLASGSPNWVERRKPERAPDDVLGGSVLGGSVLGGSAVGGGVLRGNGCRVFRLRRDKAGLAKGDLIMVVPVTGRRGAGPEGAEPEGGEIVVDLQGRVGRHAGGRNADGRSGGPVWGVVVGVIHERSR